MRIAHGLVAVLALALPVLAVPPAHGSAPAATVVAQAPYPGHGAASTAVSQDGRTLVVETRAGLTSYAIGPKVVKRLGTTAIPGNAYQSKMLLSPGGRYLYVVQENVARGDLKIFALNGGAPRLVRTLSLASVIHDPKDRFFRDATLTPDGRRLHLLGQGFVQVLVVRDPRHPVSGSRTDTFAGASTITATADGKHVVVGYGADEPRVARYLLRTATKLKLETTAPVVVPGWEGRTDRTWISKLLPGSGGGSVLVQLGSYYDEGGESAQEKTAIARIRVGDLGVAAATVPNDSAKQLFLEDLSSNGRRVYLTSGHTTDEPELLPRTALWTDSTTLRARHPLGRLGDVRSLSVSPGGSTRDRLLAAVVRGDRHLVLEVDPR
ncbi:hypothetical protein ASC77_24755 [Nocardioides sp. Root1257]|uniref:hypothetical protein n=1 Tax=unclassified Nocardioides TaxID=2615069 RepID=UPI0006F228E6|nr:MULTISPECIES: hypothetical protein [unclassified Nocardioides]KQW52579.1 hypothetical protein ASC77_24755 [Nocardioides sp. Root1257]KRC54642.1 hypothetical protein ASE24_24545 [Nocardioides sp. Root224]